MSLQLKFKIYVQNQIPSPRLQAGLMQSTQKVMNVLQASCRCSADMVLSCSDLLISRLSIWSFQNCQPKKKAKIWNCKKKIHLLFTNNKQKTLRQSQIIPFQVTIRYSGKVMAIFKKKLWQFPQTRATSFSGLSSITRNRKTLAICKVKNFLAIFSPNRNKNLIAIYFYNEHSMYRKKVHSNLKF